MTKAWEYSEAVENVILDRLMEGESLRKICKDDDMPSRATVIRWQNERPAFETKCARARVMQADYMDDLVLDVANDCTPETAAADRVKISAYQWRAAKLAPKKYGDKLALDGDGDGGPIVVEVRRFSLPKPE